MKLSDRLDKVLQQRNLGGVKPKPKPKPEPKPEPAQPMVKSPQPPTSDHDTVQEGLLHLDAHRTDEDGAGSFTANSLAISNIQLPMHVGNYIVEDIQRTKTGIFQVQFRLALPTKEK